jgi:hypothetical protein
VERVQIFDSKPPTTNEALNALEARLNIKLVPAHRAWLLQHNGGRPSPNTFQRKQVDGSAYSDGVVAWFLAVHNLPASNLEWRFCDFHRHTKRMPVDLMPIASDPFGNYICIVFNGPNLGKIYFWDHEEELNARDAHGNPTYDNCDLIAGSFDEFINGLQD